MISSAVCFVFVSLYLSVIAGQIDDHDAVRALALIGEHVPSVDFAHAGEFVPCLYVGYGRISIARALMKNAPILILDDSVSAVDTDTEKVILENLRETRRGKTTILIAHRISTIEGLDKIVFVEDGRVIAVGSHAELLTSCPAYARMVELQRLEDESRE